MVDTMKMNEDEYREHMDRLATSVGKVLNGQRIEDGMSACAACIGFGMVHLKPEDHDKMRKHVNNIIDAIVERTPRPQ